MRYPRLFYDIYRVNYPTVCDMRTVLFICQLFFRRGGQTVKNLTLFNLIFPWPQALVGAYRVLAAIEYHTGVWPFNINITAFFGNMRANVRKGDP